MLEEGMREIERRESKFIILFLKEEIIYWQLS